MSTACLCACCALHTSSLAASTYCCASAATVFTRLRSSLNATSSSAILTNAASLLARSSLTRSTAMRCTLSMSSANLAAAAALRCSSLASSIAPVASTPISLFSAPTRSSSRATCVELTCCSAAYALDCHAASSAFFCIITALDRLAFMWSRSASMAWNLGWLSFHVRSSTASVSFSSMHFLSSLRSATVGASSPSSSICLACFSSWVMRTYSTWLPRSSLIMSPCSMVRSLSLKADTASAARRRLKLKIAKFRRTGL
mmetsp:Transcript_22060/g.54597  ORF Transcript_22060/g.54597 Transcript_22060/m.54597 type:complete len:258 (+) Transcript_22060:236-1009(+)